MKWAHFSNYLGSAAQGGALTAVAQYQDCCLNHKETGHLFALAMPGWGCEPGVVGKSVPNNDINTEEDRGEGWERDRNAEAQQLYRAYKSCWTQSRCHPGIFKFFHPLFFMEARWALACFAARMQTSADTRTTWGVVKPDYCLNKITGPTSETSDSGLDWCMHFLRLLEQIVTNRDGLKLSELRNQYHYVFLSGKSHGQRSLVGCCP